MQDTLEVKESRGKFQKPLRFVKTNIVMLVAFAAALTTIFFVPFDREYLGYFDVKTLVCLFCVLAVVTALKRIDFFNYLAEMVVARLKNFRVLTLALIYITFIASMFIANDMALLTFLPLGYYVLKATGKTKYMAFVFIMQTISANLGGMLTPFGNPQNLYLYSYFSIETAEFLKIMALPFLYAVALITIICLFVPNEKTEILLKTAKKPPAKRTALYLILFCVSIAVVFKGVPYMIGLLLVVAVLSVADVRSLMKVDYGLLLTFCAFFVFSGNMARIPEVNTFLSGLIAKNTLLFGVLSCQLISNVPTAVLLSKFTTDYRSLLLAVNIGGLGTLISSLASLITFREYVSHNPTGQLKYVGLFSVLNFGLLAIMFVLVKFAC